MKNSDLWQAFFTEVSEQLDNLELILAASDAESHADIHQLFRDFHTIKSSCAMMDFHSLEKIAHASEDYLDLVRKGRTALEPTTINTLLAGIDWLKLQLQQMRNTGNAPPENSVLVEQLHQLSYGFSNAATPEESDTTDTEHSAAGFFTEVQLSSDELHEFATACTEELVAGLTPEQEPAKIKRSLNKLVSICNLLGFTAISSLLRKYIKATNPLDQGLASQLAAEILNRIALFEKHYGVDCGTARLHAAYFDAMFVNFTQLSGRLDYLLDLIEEYPDAADTLEEGEALLKYLTINAELFGHLQLASLFRYILQILRHIKRDEIPDKRTAFYAVRRAADISFTAQMQAGESVAVAQELKNRIAELDDSIAQAMLGTIGGSTRLHLAESLAIPSDIIKLLSNSAIVLLDGAINEEKTIVEISVDANSANKMVEETLRAIEKAGKIIHSYSIFPDDTHKNTDKSCFIFIVILESGAENLSSAIDNIKASKDAITIKNIRLHKENKVDNQEKQALADKETKQNASSSTTLRIDSAALESLMTQTGELLMAHNAFSHEIRSAVLEKALSLGRKWLANHQGQHITPHNIETIRSILSTLQQAQKKIEACHEKLRFSLDAMQNRILDLRVVPVAAVFNRIPQLVQKMAETQGKKIDLSIEGASVRIDKGMVDVLMEPLIHLVRNCIDHGIEPPEKRSAAGKLEQASLVLSASQEGSTLILEIADDGRGMNLPVIRESAIRKGFIQSSDVLSDQEICQLIFLPGFSTAETITETSGRGVGMDVVITRIQHIGGNIDVHTVQGSGTRFVMTLPLSAALQDVVITQIGNHIYAIAQSRVVEIIATADCFIQTIMGQSALLLQDTVVPLFYLDDLTLKQGQRISAENNALTFRSINEDAASFILIIGQKKNKIGICVDAVLGRENVFVRELHKDLRNSPSISGATVRSNGELAFILNSHFLQQYAQNNVLSWMSHLEEQAI